MTHTSTEQPEALRLADALRDGQYSLYQERAATEAELRRLHARVQELEEDLQLARQGIGAEAYDMACEEMEAYQLKRAKAGKEAGTTLSLVDGMAWVYERLDELEAQVQRVPLSERKIRHIDAHSGLDAIEFARAIERAHGIGKDKA